MSLYFGGLPVVPQSVNILDNSTGFLGFDREAVTATSIISDTIWGQAIPEIWCNQQASAIYAFITNALIVAVRDNSSYFDVLGIVSRADRQLLGYGNVAACSRRRTLPAADCAAGRRSSVPGPQARRQRGRRIGQHCAGTAPGGRRRSDRRR